MNFRLNDADDSVVVFERKLCKKSAEVETISLENTTDMAL